MVCTVTGLCTGTGIVRVGMLYVSAATLLVARV